MARSGRLVLALAAAAVLAAGCDQKNQYVAPPPPKVGVAKPVQQKVTRYFEATGNTAALNTANLVARVQGFVEAIKYQDGASVNKGDPLFIIEQEPYRLKLQQTQAAEAGAEATLKQAQADFDRQTELVQRQAASRAALETSTANRAASEAKLNQAKVDTSTAQINLGYTTVVAPFNGVVMARQVSVGEFVGAGTATPLATIVQLDPIYVNFTASERDVLRTREILAQRGQTATSLKGTPVDVGLQTEQGYPHQGELDYIAPQVSQSTGTLALRAVLKNPKAVLLPGYFVRVRVPITDDQALLVPDVALGSDQGGRYVLVVNGESVIEQRKVEIGPKVGELRVIESGLKPEDRVVVSGIIRAIPGQKVDPQEQPIGAGT